MCALGGVAVGLLPDVVTHAAARAQALDFEDLRKRRESVTVEVRRARRDDGLQRKRRDLRSESIRSSAEDACSDDWSQGADRRAARDSGGTAGRSIHEPFYPESLQTKIENIPVRR